MSVNPISNQNKRISLQSFEESNSELNWCFDYFNDMEGVVESYGDLISSGGEAISYDELSTRRPDQCTVTAVFEDKKDEVKRKEVTKLVSKEMKRRKNKELEAKQKENAKKNSTSDSSVESTLNLMGQLFGSFLSKDKIPEHNLKRFISYKDRSLFLKKEIDEMAYGIKSFDYLRNCCLAHSRYLTKLYLQNPAVTSLSVSITPSGYVFDLLEKSSAIYKNRLFCRPFKHPIPGPAKSIYAISFYFINCSNPLLLTALIPENYSCNTFYDYVESLLLYYRVISKPNSFSLYTTNVKILHSSNPLIPCLRYNFDEFAFVGIELEETSISPEVQSVKGNAIKTMKVNQFCEVVDIQTSHIRADDLSALESMVLDKNCKVSSMTFTGILNSFLFI